MRSGPRAVQVLTAARLFPRPRLPVRPPCCHVRACPTLPPLLSAPAIALPRTPALQSGQGHRHAPAGQEGVEPAGLQERRVRGEAAQVVREDQLGPSAEYTATGKSPCPRAPTPRVHFAHVHTPHTRNRPCVGKVESGRRAGRGSGRSVQCAEWVGWAGAVCERGAVALTDGVFVLFISIDPDNITT